VLSGAFVLVWSSGYGRRRASRYATSPRWRSRSGGSSPQPPSSAVVAAVRRERWPRGRALWSAAGIGVLIFGVQFGPLYYGIAQGVPAGTTALIACSAPLLVAVFSVPLGWERLARQQWAGVALGVVGVAVTLADRVGRPPHVLDLA
jgi:drug/metabolite transporter (DMT)-like permease